MKRRSAPVKGERLIKTVTFDVKQARDAERTIEHVITRRIVDRDGDVVEPRGARLENYRQNPVVLFGHWSFGFPIGRNVAMEVGDVEIIARTQFAGLDQADGEAECAYRLARDGFLRAWSIGFMPITWSEDKALPEQDGWWFKEWELYEYSLVAIPSNPAALSRMAKAYGLPNGASERDLADALRRDRQPYWDIAASLAQERSPIAFLEAREDLGLDAIRDEVRQLREDQAEILRRLDGLVRLEPGVTKPETVQPDAHGRCPEGWEMGEDGMCHEKGKGCRQARAKAEDVKTALADAFKQIAGAAR